VSSPTLDPGLQVAVAEHRRGHLDEAERRFRTRLDTHPQDAFALHQLGIIALQRSKPADAVPLLAAAAALDPANTTLLQHWGDALSGLGRHADAEALYRRALGQQPRHAAARLHLGNALRAQGRARDAEAEYREVLQLDPGSLRAHANLGQALNDQGRFPEAFPIFEHALALGDTSLETQLGLTQALLEAGALVRCEATARQTLARFPGEARLLTLLGEGLRRSKSFDEAEAILQQAVSRPPAPLAAWHNLGKLMIDRGRPTEAETVFRQLIPLAPALAEIQHGLSVALLAQRKHAEAESVLRTLTRDHPGYAKGWAGLARTIAPRAPSEAIAYARRALALAPADDDCITALADALYMNGEIALALETQRKAVEKPAPDSRHASTLLAMTAYTGARTPGEILELARTWNGLIPRTVPLPPASPSDASTVRAPASLRIGYISPDFRDHAVASFFEPILRAHREQGLDVFLYAELAVPDATTSRLRAQVAPDRWHFMHGLTDDAAARLVRSHRIDVLIDLSGHTRGHRLGIFAQRAAPVQACYLGYYGTTGLAEMDYWIGDEILLPPTLDATFVERLWRLPRCWLSYLPPADSPPAEPRSVRPGLTFGSFNNRQKLSPATLDLWSAVLRALPDAHLLVKTAGLEETAQRVRLETEFRLRGIASERLSLRPPAADRHSHLRHYQEVDIALDSTPFTGGTTTAESLWMGVPVLTLVGSTMPSRMSASFLSAVGMPEWIAASPEEFVRRAQEHATAWSGLDADERGARRHAVRAALVSSPLADASGLARALTDAYWEMTKKVQEKSAIRPGGNSE